MEPVHKTVVNRFQGKKYLFDIEDTAK